MSNTVKAGLIAVLIPLAIATGAALFIGTGVYNIGADDHHTKPVFLILDALRERSVAVRASAIVAPPLDDPKKIAAGAELYASLCVSCHLAPGVTKSTVRAGLYPHPPNLSQEANDHASQAFWTIKHGIKMSAMPAWGKSLDDSAMWNIVAFIGKMPQMSADEYQRLSRNE